MLVLSVAFSCKGAVQGGGNRLREGVGWTQGGFAWVSGSDVPPLSLGNPVRWVRRATATDQKPSALTSRCWKLLCLP